MKTMAQQQTENQSEVNNTDENGKISGSSNLQNGTEPLSAAGKSSGHTHHQSQQPPHLHQQHPHPQQHPHSQQLNSRPSVQQLHQVPGNMNEKNQNTKSPPNQGGQQGGMMPSNNGGNEPQSHPYGSSSSEVGVGPPPQMSHYPPPMQQPSTIENPNKDDPYNQQPPVGAHPYGRYHHHDPNVPPDPYGRYGHPGLQPGKPPGGMIPPNRPPQRYLPGQPPQGPTPTLNSLLQSHPPPPPQHRYPNNYDPQQQQQGSQQQPPPPQSYGPQQGWAPPPRPYSPQLGPSQTYRTPPPANSSRGQSPYPPPGQSPGSYPPSPQSGPPPPAQGPPVSSQYSPYPQRYPTPPGPAGGPNHRTPYPPHQYPEPTRSWPGGPGGPSPAASPGPGSHPHPPASPHQTQHGGPPPSSPGHAPSPSPQPPQPSPSPHQYPNRPSQASTPNTNDIETGESIGQNSNDSSCGGVTGVGSGPPGTPNPQQAMRPTPSPTGSSGSRSMSPAVGQQSLPMPPRPSSSQSQSGLNQLPPTTVGVISNNSNIANAPHHHQHHQQSQQQQIPPQNLDSSGSAPSRSQASGALPNSQPPPHQQQSGQGNSSMAAQGSYQTPPPPLSHMHGYKMGPTPGQGPGAGPQNMPPYPPPQSQQYSQGNYPPRPQYPGTYGPTPPPGQPPPSSMPPNTGQYPGRPMPNHVGAPHSQFPPYQQSWPSPSPQATNMMSNHVQGKGTPPPSQQNLGSPRPLNYLKQHLQHKGGYGGAQSPTPPQGYGNGPGMHPPMGPPHHMGPPLGPTSMGPPTSAPQNNPTPPTPPSGANSHSEGNSTPDPTVSQDNGVSSSASSNVSSHPVTSVVTTGPDGTPLDEASQQSTLSNASAASGEDPQQCTTPKSRRSESCNQSHLAPPSASPGAHPHNEEFEMNSPSSWPRTPASPVFNSHVPQETYRISSKKSDSLCKLFEMDDNPDRRIWLDKLLGFMEERRTPITACPTISKQPLDLYRLYMLVKERGGFVEVTKSKTWKDIAGLLGIGASSSAAYTLRKHYTKNLLAFECHFDRGGIDPLPIIQQVEAGSKKKAAKAASVPSPVGSSNSQDSFPPPGASSGSMDSYPGYPGGYTPGTQTDYNAPPQMQRPPSQNSTQAPHAANTPYQGQPGGYSQYNAPDQYGASAPPGQYPPGQGQFPPPNRTMYPQYGSENESAPPPSNSYVPYAPPPRPYNQPPAAAPQTQPPAASSQAPPGPAVTYPPPPPQQDYYRQPPEQSSQPRRHPDFAKEPQPYPPYGQRPQMYNWQNSSNQYRAQYPTQSSPQQWNSAQRPTGPPPPQSQTSASQWDHSRYPPQNQQQYPPNQQQWSNMNSACPPTSQTTPLRPPQRGNAKPFTMPPPQGTKPAQPSQQPFAPTGQQQKRDIVFPPESIEATTPVLYKRKRLTKNDVCPVDPWRIFMALRSGLLSDSTWALDILNILLFDDTAVHYFGLKHLPGLLNLLLDHFQKNLSDMFDPNNEHKHGYGWNCFKKAHDEDDECDVDLGQVTNPPNPEERVLILTSTTNYTMSSRKGVPVRIQNSEDDIFISEFPKKWDLDSNKNYQLSVPVGSDPWTFGHEEPHPHDNIIDTFKAEIVDIPFARYLKSDRKDKIDSDDLDEDDMEGEPDEIDVKREKSVSVTIGRNKKRRILSKNCLTDTNMGKRVKLKDVWKTSKLDFKTEIKQEVDDDDGDQTADRVIKKEPMDSDCREVDMEIEPRLPNGPHQEESCPINDEEDEKMSADNNSLLEEKIKIDILKKSDNTDDKFDPKETVRDPSAILKRRRMSEYEDECYTRDEASLYLVNESHDTLARRCICLSNILRNLTFVPGNEAVLAKSSTFLALLGKLLLLNHEHLVRTQKTRNYDREEDTDFADSCSSLQGESEWWWDYLIQIRENMLVAVANIAGHLELSRYEEIITRPVLDGLLHWAVCPSAHGQDPFPSCGPHSALSPQRLALEALCKLCVTDANVDLVIATPPFSRLEKLCSVLTRHLCRNEDQVLREFSVNLLHYLAAADSAMSRTVALQSPCISYLVAFIEQAEQTALGVANQHGINYLRENPDSMGTSLDMLRRAAGTLLHLSKHPDNRPLFMQQEQRLLGLVMSHILDQQVALIISRVLFQVSRGTEPVTSSEFKLNQRRQQQKLKLENLISSPSILSSSSCLIPSSNLQTSFSSPALLHSGSHSNRSISPSNAASGNQTVNLATSTTSSTSVSSLNVDNTNFNYTNSNVASCNTSSNNNGSITSGNSSILNSNCNSNSSTSSGSSSCSSAANNNSSNSNSNNNSNNNSSNFCGEINRQQTNVSCSNNNSSSNISNLSNSNVSNNSSSNNNGNMSKNISTRATTNSSNSNSSTPTTAAVA